MKRMIEREKIYTTVGNSRGKFNLLSSSVFSVAQIGRRFAISVAKITINRYFSCT